MEIQENIPLAPKTTMRIGGVARWFADVKTQKDIEEAWTFAQKNNLPIVMLGAGSNTVFADGMIEALVIHIGANAVEISGNSVRAEAGIPLATLVVQCARNGLDLSALTGIPGTLGGAIFGNAGQGPQGTWIDHFVQTVTIFEGEEWKTLSKEECGFAYRDSIFKRWPANRLSLTAYRFPIIWKTTLSVPSRSPEEIEKDISLLLKKRLLAQPNMRTAGSCFTALPDGTPAWKLIEAAGLKGMQIHDLQVSAKHANFLINTGSATFADLLAVVEKIRSSVNHPLHLEMRLIGEKGNVLE